MYMCIYIPKGNVATDDEYNGCYHSKLGNTSNMCRLYLIYYH